MRNGHCIQIAAVLTLAVFSSGCATGYVQTHLIRGPRRETVEFDRTHGAYRGYYGGVVEREIQAEDHGGKRSDLDNARFHRFAFLGPLKGENRWLVLYLPVETGPGRDTVGTASESPANPLTDTRPAYLCVSTAGTGRTTHDQARAFLKSYGADARLLDEYPAYLEMPLYGGVAEIEADSLCFSSPVAESGFRNGLYWVNAKPSFRSVERQRFQARMKPFMGYACLAGTIPFDIITSPIQFLMWFNDIANM